jgi:hypothetical protein
VSIREEDDVLAFVRSSMCGHSRVRRFVGLNDRHYAHVGISGAIVNETSLSEKLAYLFVI